MKFLCFLLLVPLVAFSATKKLTWKQQSFSISLPDSWRTVNDLYGIPVTLLGPVINDETRVVIQLIPTGQKSATLTTKDAQLFNDQYAKGREEWVKSQNGTLIETLNGKLGKTAAGIDWLEAGVSYQINLKSFAERTYYVQCPKQIVHLKIILNVGLIESMPEAETIVRSFQCDG